jgi:hypothetical protein
MERDITSIDFRQYVQGMRVNALDANTLAQQLEQKAPRDLDEHERRALERVLARGLLINGTLSARDWVAPGVVRPLIVDVANAWGAVHESLGAVARLPEKLSDRKKTADQLLRAFFPDGIAFVKLGAGAVWNESKRRLDDIAARDLRAQMDNIIGADMLVAVEQATTALGAIIGAQPGDHERPNPTALADNLATFIQSVAYYCRLLSARVDPEATATFARFRKAVRPIDDYRAAHPVTRATDAEGDEDLTGGDDTDHIEDPEPNPEIDPTPTPIPPT